jgi:hypothetical protein
MLKRLQKRGSYKVFSARRKLKKFTPPLSVLFKRLVRYFSVEIAMTHRGPRGKSFIEFLETFFKFSKTSNGPHDK